MTSKYPNCDRMAAPSECAAGTILDFLWWLSQRPPKDSEQGSSVIVLAEYDSFGNLRHLSIPKLELVQEYLGVDWKALEAEREAILADLNMVRLAKGG